MEVVVLSVANSDKGANYVDERCVFWSVLCRTRVSAGVSISILGAHTHSRGILAKVGLLVAAEESLGLGLGGSAARQLLVEAHDLLHADSIGGGADSLFCKSAQIQNRHGESSGIAIGSAVGELRS